MPKEKCHFDRNGKCYALACYSSEKCGARDREGCINYATVEEIEEMERKEREDED